MSEKRPDAAKKSNRKAVTYLIIIIFSFLTLLGSLAIIFSVYVNNRIDKEADINMYRNACRNSITRFYYVKNDIAEELEGSEIYSAEKLMYASYDTIPQMMVNAFIAIEDKRFYEHNGVDWYRTAGAAANYILKFRNSFGASTITQQLVKNVTGNDDYSVQRKLQEIFYAQSLEKQLEKWEILELYLNIINLSQGCKGVRSAAMTYFSKELSELDMCECVCIAAITQNPSYYDPYLNPENNKARRQVIFDLMLLEGYISAEEHKKYYDMDVKINMSDRYAGEKINSWYIDMVIDDVRDELCKKCGYSYEQASELIYTGGLQIYTVMDPDIQKTVEDYYRDESNFSDGEGIKAQSSMMIIDPYTGDILAVAGGRGEKKANRIQNYATQTVRPSGSVIKPLSIYAPALELGLINYATVFDDVPVDFGEYNLDSDKGEIVYPKAWPSNAPNVYHGLVNVNYAIEVSLNTVPIKVLELLGKESSFFFLKEKLGMESLIEELTLENGTVITDMDTAALALGQMNYGVTVREVTSAYTMFANEGEYCKSRSYSKVIDAHGRVILENEIRESRAISKDNSIIMNKMLQNVVDNGTAKYITLDEKIDVAGKTGTSQDYHDRWFIGYTPYYLGGVWYGYEYPKPLESDTQYICTKIWNDIMLKLHEELNEDERGFASSENIISVNYCKDSGKLLSEACLADPRGIRAERGYFVKGSEPKERCDCHILVAYDKNNGGVVIGECPEEDVEYVGMILAERSFPTQVYVSDAQYVWRELPDGIVPSVSKNEPFFANAIESGEYCGISHGEIQFNRMCTRHFDYFKWYIKEKIHKTERH